MVAAGRVVGHVPTGGTLSWSAVRRDGGTNALSIVSINSYSLDLLMITDHLPKKYDRDKDKSNDHKVIKGFLIYRRLTPGYHLNGFLCSWDFSFIGVVDNEEQDTITQFPVANSPIEVLSPSLNPTPDYAHLRHVFRLLIRGLNKVYIYLSVRDTKDINMQIESHNIAIDYYRVCLD